MESLLKSKTVHVDSLGKKVKLIELSALAFFEVTKASSDGEGIRAAAIACKYGVAEWKDESVEDVMQNVPLTILQDLSERIIDLSEFPKASASDPSDASSSA